MFYTTKHGTAAAAIVIALLILTISAGAYYFIFFIPAHDKALRNDIIAQIEEAWQMRDSIRQQVDSAKMTNIFLEQMEYKRLMDEMSTHAVGVVEQLQALQAQIEQHQKDFDEYRLSVKVIFDRSAEEEGKQQQELSVLLKELEEKIRKTSGEAARALNRLDKFGRTLEAMKAHEAEQLRSLAETFKIQEKVFNERLKAIEAQIAKLSEPTAPPVARTTQDIPRGDGP